MIAQQKEIALIQLVEAVEEIINGAIKINRQDSRITNWSLKLAKDALAHVKEGE